MDYVYIPLISRCNLHSLYNTQHVLQYWATVFCYRVFQYASIGGVRSPLTFDLVDDSFFLLTHICLIHKYILSISVTLSLLFKWI